MSNFVTLTQEQFEENLPSIFRMVEVPNCKEIVYHVPTNQSDIEVRIYSTIDMRTGVTRSIGSDAIRVVFWDMLNDKPIGKGKKILRVEGATSIGDRLASRIKQFQDESTSMEVAELNYSYVKAILEHDTVNWNHFAESLLEGLNQYGSLTDNQLAWVLGDKNPKGRKTFEAIVLSKYPDFKDTWENTQFVEDDVYEEDIDDILDSYESKPEPVEPAEVEVEVDPYEDVDSMELASTKDYKYYKYPFPTFNPVQTMTLPHARTNTNLVIGANTSAGKTICAELLMDWTLRKGKRVIYLSPLKALTQEKYDDWKVRFKKHKISILTGDYTLSEKKKTELNQSKIIVMTSEMCDSRTRKMKSEKNFWLKQVGLVVVDESHILSTGRGHAVEAGIMRFTSINKKARILFLSATMPNCDELAEWLTKLNGKESRVVFSTWRPVELNMNYVEYEPAQYESGREDYWGTQAIKQNLAIDIVKSKPDEKFLIFVHDKGTGRRIVKALENEHIEAYFHNADLDMANRLEVEKKFEDRENGIRVLVSTSTLAWGRNLPARNVIIVGVHRGLDEVDELDIIQMAGRAGRYGIDDKGFVFLIVPYWTVEDWKDVFINPRPVKSVLDENMPFHVIAEIETKTIQDSPSLLQWYERSLAYHQDTEKSFNIEKSDYILNAYSEMEMIEGDGINISPTGLGKVCAWLYFDPRDVYGWYKNFDAVFHSQEVDDQLLSWAVGDVPMNYLPYTPKPLTNQYQSFISDMSMKHNIRCTGAVIGAIALHHAITGADVPDALKAIHRALIWDIERINSALALIDLQYAGWKSNLWKSLPLRFKYGVAEEVVPLTRIKMVGGKRALSLFNQGLTSVEDVAKAPIKKLVKVLTPAMAKKIKANAKALLKEENNV